MREARVTRDVGARIRAARKEQGLSQEKLAYQVGVEQTEVSKIERGAEKPSPEFARKLAVALGLDENAFLEA